MKRTMLGRAAMVLSALLPAVQPATASVDGVARAMAQQAAASAAAAAAAVSTGSGSSLNIAAYPAATSITGSELVPCQLSTVISKCTSAQQSAYTLSNAITALPAATALAGPELSNIVQNGAAARSTVAQLGAYVAGLAASYPAASPLTGTEVSTCLLGTTILKCTAATQSAYTLSTAIAALPAATTLTGAELSNIVQAGGARSVTPQQLVAGGIVAKGYTGLGATRTVTLPASFAAYTSGLNLGTMSLYEDPERTVGMLSRTPEAIFGDFSTALSAPGVTYYVSTAGNTSNDCLTGTTTCSTISRAVALGNASGATSMKIVVLGSLSGPTYFDRTSGCVNLGGVSQRPKIDVAFVARNGLVICTTADLAATYAADATLTNAYTGTPYVSSAGSPSVQIVLDKTAKPDRYGHKPQLTLVTSAAIVNATPGTYWWDSANAKVWIHRADGLPVTAANTDVLLSGDNMRLADNVNMYIGSDDGTPWGFEGSDGGAIRIVPTATQTATKRLSIISNVYARYSANAFAIDLYHGYVLAFNVEGGGTKNDVWNTHLTGNPSGVQTFTMALNLVCQDLGWANSASGSNNCFTGHENGVKSAALGGRFLDSAGTNVGFIDASEFALLGTTVQGDRGDTWVGTTAQFPSLIGVSQTATAWLDGVRLQGYAPMVAIVNKGTGAVYTRNMAPMMLPIRNLSTGTIAINGW